MIDGQVIGGQLIDGRLIDGRLTGDLRRAHRLLCSPLIEEAEFRAALGDGRANIGTVARYLRLSAAERPALTPFFDPVFYRIHSRDLPDDADPLLEFLDHGLAAWRDPHPLIDLRHIAGQDELLLGDPPDGAAVAAVLAGDLADPSPYFDRAFYAAQLGSPPPAGSGGLLRHFLTAGLADGRQPNRWLDPDWYGAAYDDVPAGRYAALRHFVLLGDPLGRASGTLFDGALYQRRYTDVADARMAPLRHFLAYGRQEGRQPASDRPPPRPRAAPAAEFDVGEAAPIEPAALLAGHAALARRLDALRQADKDAVQVEPPPLVVSHSPAADLARIRLPASAAPRLSILIAAHEQAAHTVACLLAISANPPACGFEVVLADDGSRGPVYARLAAVANLAHVRLPANCGFVHACNAGFRRCRGEYVLLLNNDAQPLPGAIDRLVASLDDDPGLAAVGPKIVYPDGRLQEAGCFLRPDGESGMVGLFADPADPQFGFDRDVAYCSGAALLLRRSALGDALFDDAYAPAYCEDADLCLRLRAAGHRVRYIAGARVVHHLSASSEPRHAARRHRLIARNQARLQARWAESLAAMDRVRPIAFYLPQFHPIPQNDLWWGAGFTEWSNVVRARPSYAGHYQPHLPADLGFYDLRVAETLRRQAALARRYGIEGFCVYHYDFGSQRLLDAPMAVLHANPDIAFRHCLCWANENWTRNWDGGAREILVEQQYDRITLDRVIADAVRHAADPRYIRVEGQPLFLVYRPLRLPDAAGFSARLRAAFRAAGFAGAHLAYVESMEAAGHGLRPADIGFDAAVEFPPHGSAVAAEDAAAIVKPGWAGYRYDYAETVLAFLRREGVGHRRYPTVFPSWDNTPRQAMHGTSFDGATPEAFGFYVEQTIEAMRGIPGWRAPAAVHQRLERVGRGRASGAGQRLWPSLAGGAARRAGRTGLALTAAPEDVPITLVGHPFAPIGMGEQLRSHVAALDAMRLQHGVLDIFRHSSRTDDAHAAMLDGREIAAAPGGIRIFHVNGNEVERVLDAFAARGGSFEDGYNIVMPAWELSVYPSEWTPGLRRFDEIWAISRFVQVGLAAAGLASHLVGQSVEPPPGPRLPRRWFAIRESAFVLLHMLDLSSYAERKNPQAARKLFAALRAARPAADLQLVIKVKNAEVAAEEWAAALPADPHMRVISAPLDSLGARSLIAACDCFVSLHRAEGFGRGLGEAMAMGRLALGTGWSGNLDFMSDANSVLVPAAMVAVRRGAYPHGRGQRWAEPDLATAAARLLALIDDPAQAAALAARGRREVLASHGHRAVGLRILDRLERIVAERPGLASSAPAARGQGARQRRRASGGC